MSRSLETILSQYKEDKKLKDDEMSELVKAYRLAPRFHLAGSPEVGIPYPLEYRAWSFKGDDLRSEFRDGCKEKITQAVNELKTDPFNRGKIDQTIKGVSSYVDEFRTKNKLGEVDAEHLFYDVMKKGGFLRSAGFDIKLTKDAAGNASYLVTRPDYGINRMEQRYFQLKESIVPDFDGSASSIIDLSRKIIKNQDLPAKKEGVVEIGTRITNEMVGTAKDYVDAAEVCRRKHQQRCERCSQSIWNCKRGG